MTHSLSRNTKRVLGIVILSAALLPLGAIPASAATMVSQTGSIGHTVFKDTATKPGATCTYEGAAGTFYFNGMKLKSIRVEYPDQNSSAVEHGKVGYKIALQHSSGGSFSTLVTSPETKITAFDNAFAKFPKRTQVWNGATAMGGKWRAEVILTWYNPDSSVKGRGTWTIDNYQRDYNNSIGTQCKGKWSPLL